MLLQQHLLPDRAIKHAVMLLAVDPCLKGLLIASNKAPAEIGVAKFYQGISPDDLLNIVKIPLNVTEDRLLGSINLERTLATGQRHSAPGLLAQADTGLLSVDNINLLDVSMIHYIADALDSGSVQLERESISELHPARFVLIGTFDKSEGDMNVTLGDRIGLTVEPDQSPSEDDRVMMLEQEIFAHGEIQRLYDEYLDEVKELKAIVRRAAKELPRVKVSRKNIRNLIEAGMQLGVEGNRADIFALRVARANAAIAGRRAVIEEDIIAAIKLVLLPRANRLPEIEDHSPQPQRENDEQNNQDKQSDDRRASNTTKSSTDMIVKAADSRLSDNVLKITKHASRSSAPGKRIDSRGSARGRYAGSMMKRPREARIAIDATLRAAAPFQVSRRQASVSDISIKSDTKLSRTRHIRIIPDDLRYKRFKRKAGTLFIFCVDASGSMAANRMAYAKGALTRLLQNAYLHRDKVALISFRGEDAEVLLEPTRSVELGKRLIDALPAGGGTPLAKGLLRAIEMARLSRSKERSNAMLVIFTDGRANVALRASDKDAGEERRAAIRDELKQIGAAIQTEGISSVIIDTRSKFLSAGEGLALADWLGGRYIYLPRANADSIYDVVASTATGAGSRNQS